MYPFKKFAAKDISARSRAVYDRKSINCRFNNEDLLPLEKAVASCINRFYASMIASFMHGTMLWVSAIASVENSNLVTPVERRVKR